MPETPWPTVRLRAPAAVSTVTVSPLAMVTSSAAVGTTPPDQVAVLLQLPPPVPLETMMAAGAERGRAVLGPCWFWGACEPVPACGALWASGSTLAEDPPRTSRGACPEAGKRSAEVNAVTAPVAPAGPAPFVPAWPAGAAELPWGRP